MKGRRNDGSRLARLAELVHTLTGIQGTKRVLLLADGASTAGLFPGVPTGGPITLHLLDTPNGPVPKPPPRRQTAPDDDGRLGPATANAILAFQKRKRLNRTGVADSATKKRLASARRP
ncbi:MAG TPA: peptidoglycan-binding domain-containing protein [Gaiellaceae bacterium]|nr:peptidoglycan-binding domain-containing protein [Gaiellaceae bacterium]